MESIAELRLRLGLHEDEVITDERPAPWYRCPRCDAIYLPATSYAKAGPEDIAPYWTNETEFRAPDKFERDQFRAAASAALEILEADGAGCADGSYAPLPTATEADDEAWPLPLTLYDAFNFRDRAI